jgi:hypothetical protein
MRVLERPFENAPTINVALKNTPVLISSPVLFRSVIEVGCGGMEELVLRERTMCSYVSYYECWEASSHHRAL